jgi:hypothetical protein
MLMDISFIYMMFVLAVLAFVFGFFGSYWFFKRWGGPVVRQFINLRRKAKAIILQLAPDNLWRFIPVTEKFGNFWKTPEGVVAVTPEHIHPVVGLSQMVIQNTLAADPNDAFSYYALQLAEKSPDKPPQLNEIITYLKKREEALEDIINAVVNIKSNKDTIRSAAESIMAKRSIPISDELAYQAIAQRLYDAVSTDAKEYSNELARVKEALKITAQPKEWEFVTDETGNVIDVVSNEILEADDFFALTPAGTVNDVQTVTQRNEAVAVKEAQFTMNSAMKYITVGVVIFIVLVALAYFLKSQGL